MEPAEIKQLVEIHSDLERITKSVEEFFLSQVGYSPTDLAGKELVIVVEDGEVSKRILPATDCAPPEVTVRVL